VQFAMRGEVLRVGGEVSFIQFLYRVVRAEIDGMPMEGCRTPAKHVVSQENPWEQPCKVVDLSLYKSVILSNVEDSFRHILCLWCPHPAAWADVGFDVRVMQQTHGIVF
jgi:hypothetical protein